MLRFVNHAQLPFALVYQNLELACVSLFLQ